MYPHEGSEARRMIEGHYSWVEHDMTHSVLSSPHKWLMVNNIGGGGWLVETRPDRVSPFHLSQPRYWNVNEPTTHYRQEDKNQYSPSGCNGNVCVEVSTCISNHNDILFLPHRSGRGTLRHKLTWWKSLKEHFLFCLILVLHFKCFDVTIKGTKT